MTDCRSPLPVFLLDEGDDRGRAAAGRRTCGRAEIVDVQHALKRRLVDMDMGIDPARQHELVRGVDRLGGVPEIAAEHGDAAVLHADVAADDIGRGDDGAVADEQIELCHGRSLLADRVHSGGGLAPVRSTMRR